jgi:hypothetical protein
VLILASFLIHVGTPADPGFLWGLYALGYAIWIAAFVRALVQVRRVGRGLPRAAASPG